MRIYLCALFLCLIATPILAKPGKNGSNNNPASLILSFEANQTTVAPGERVQLSWASSGVSSCVATGAWDGQRGLSGAENTLALQTDSTFTLTCKRKNRRVVESVFVQVTQPDPEPEPDPLPPPQPEPELPSLQLTSSHSQLTAGESTTLSWQSENATSCEASGGWQGIKAPSGGEVIANIVQTQSYAMTCTGDGGSAVAIISVSAIGELTLSWQTPTNNTDGTSVAGIANYKLYRGIEPGKYEELFDIPGDLNSFKVSAEVGTRYYFAISAIDINGAESSYSDEVSGLAQ